jgi:hypothetical protein
MNKDQQYIFYGFAVVAAVTAVGLFAIQQTISYQVSKVDKTVDRLPQNLVNAIGRAI